MCGRVNKAANIALFYEIRKLDKVTFLVTR